MFYYMYIDSTNERLVQEIVVLVFHRCLYYNYKQNVTCPLVETNFNLLVIKSTSHSFAALTREISTWTLQDKIRIHVRACNILYVPRK